MTTQSQATFALDELKKEQTFRGMGATKARDIPRIDLTAFAARKAEIAEQLWNASTEIGFFQLVNHGIAQQQIDEAFTMTERFFTLPQEVKARYPLGKGTNAGWEYKSQVRPSTGTADNKESYQITLPRMAGLWPPGDELPGFQGGHARLRTRQLGAGHESLVVLRAQARLQGGLFHRLSRSAVERISEHAAAPTLPADGRCQA